MPSRVKGLVFFALALVVMAMGAERTTAQQPPAAPVTPEQMKQLRKEAAHRQRHIIFNNDGDDVVYECDAATPEALLKARTTALAGTQVDTIVYCTWSSGFSIFTHNTKVGEVFTCMAEEPGKGPGSGFSKNKTQAFINQGTDPLNIMVDFCRKNRIEVFWSMRMNDVHDAWGDWYSTFLFPKVKKEHPEYLLGNADKKPKNGGWTAVDYARPEIRDLAFQFFREVCENYDVDGVELDFFRHLNFFKSPAMGEPARQEELDMMTDLLRRIRRMTEEVSLKRGHPILVSVRVPDSVELSKALGLDMVRWMEEDLIDLLVLSCYFRLNPWETSVQLGHKYGIPVYPCLSESRVTDNEALQVRASSDCYRARAAEAWQAGADGIYMFNYFNPNSALWKELGALETLRPLDKVYCAGVRGYGELTYWYKGGERFMNRTVVSPDWPRPLKPGEPVAIDLPVAETFAEGEAPEVSLRLRFKEPTTPDDLLVKVNGETILATPASETWVQCPMAPKLLKQGTNRIEISLKSGTTPSRILHDLQLWVRHNRA